MFLLYPNDNGNAGVSDKIACRNIIGLLYTGGKHANEDNI